MLALVFNFLLPIFYLQSQTNNTNEQGNTLLNRFQNRELFHKNKNQRILPPYNYRFVTIFPKYITYKHLFTTRQTTKNKPFKYLIQKIYSTNNRCPDSIFKKNYRKKVGE